MKQEAETMQHRQPTAQRRLVIALGMLGIFSPVARGADVFVYGLNLKGKLTVNGTVLDSLPSDFSEDPLSGIQERFGDLLVVGASRYALRRDGETFKDGKRLHTLPYDAILKAEWTNLVLLGTALHSLREDGVLSGGATPIAILPTTKGSVIFPFARVIGHGSDLYSLRVDGTIFKNGVVTPLFELAAGNGATGFPDGRSAETVWVRLAVSPVDGDLYAMRADGFIYKGNLPPANATEAKGVLVTKLPFPPTPPLLSGDLYVDFGFTADGKWRALRANGQIYDELHLLAPAVDLPGNGESSETAYQDLAFLANDFWSVRGDGRVYLNTGETEIFDLPAATFGRIAVSTEPPSLTSFKNGLPVVSTYSVTLFDGSSLELPVILTDSDKLAEELTVTPIEPLPPGSSWDESSRVLTWSAVGPVGKYVFLVSVSDGVQTKVYKYPIKVLAPDLLPEKNKPPVVAKIKPAQALVGYELVVAIIADDADGDSLTYSADLTGYPFTHGATFDAGTRTFRWTPAIDDVGKATARFLISDGIKTKALTLQIRIVSPLIF